MANAMEDQNWLRISCPSCDGWLGVPGSTAKGQHAQRIARRIDAFVSRHAHHEKVVP